MKNTSIKQYQEQYADLGFERAGLFKALQEQYGCTEVLYPGCSVHITPSLFFPHIVYIDQSPVAKEFFADKNAIENFVNTNKVYKRRAYIRFIDQDYTQPLTTIKGKFDLLISLYAEDVARSCKKYIELGGFLMTNNHRNDLDRIVNATEFQLISVIKNHGGKYRFYDEKLDEFIKATKKRRRTKDFLRSTSGGVEYRENIDTYFIFKKII